MRDLEQQEMEKLNALKRIKLLATLVLIGCFLAMVAAKILEHYIPAMAIVAAFAEAATIGGIADWYAVVALFKKPLNLPFPHTAIIPNNQERIGDNLGRFIENNFLAKEPVEAKLREIDFAGEMSNWLSKREHAGSLAGFVVRFLPQLLASVDEKGLVHFAANRVSAQVAKTDFAPLVGDLMESVTREGRNQRFLDEVLNALGRFLNDEETLEVIRLKVKDELPTLFYILGADNLILSRLVRNSTELLDEVRADKDHPLRAEFQTFLDAYIKRLRRRKSFARNIEKLKSQILARPELAETAEHMWASLRKFVLDDVHKDDSVLVARLTDLFVDVGTSLEHEANLRRDINTGMVLVLSNLIEEQRGNISTYVAEQVKSWDMQQLLILIEVNVGRDLQYIRFNGMIIGGCVGVVLYLIETLLLS